MEVSPAPGCPTGEPASPRDGKTASQWAFGDSDALDSGSCINTSRLLGDPHHFFSRKRRLLVNLFRNKRRRVDRFWKRAELARYLPERLLLVGPVQGGVVEAVH